MQWKISVLLLVAMLCLAFTGAAAAEDVKCCWEKPCGTEVEQCDQETTFVLYDIPDDAAIVKTYDGYVYLDINTTDTNRNDDSIITPNDIRLSNWHTNYEPNTKVTDEDADNLAVIEFFYDEAMITYMDINNNNKYDIYDPVYIDFEDKFGNQGTVSSGDIRLTDVPPVTPVKMMDAPDPLDEGAIVDTSEYDGLERWMRVGVNDADMDKTLVTIGTGNVTDLLGWVDADDSGDWNCADKMYINQPNTQCESEDFVTIGDVRLFIPPGDECVPECGTKVLQGHHDATYILNMVDELQIAKSVECNAVYVDMDNDSMVSYGDVRLSEVNKQIGGETVHYDPNTKVKVCEEADLNDNLVALDDDVVKYLDIDGLPGYTLGDPVYIDLDNEDTVSDGDIRLTDSPVFDTGALPAAYHGEAWSVVDGTYGGEDTEYGETIEAVPGLTAESGLESVIGYIDSDCTGTWTCEDKLYLQQFVMPAENTDARPGVDLSNYNKFVTAGDMRLYIPPEAIAEEEWPACGTKVTLCNIDIEYALGADFLSQVSFADRNSNDMFDGSDAAYIDMDDSKTVTDGDVRLTSVTRKNDTYEPNTKVVCCSSIEDSDVGLPLEGHNTKWYSEIYTDLLEWVNGATSIKHFDTDCSGGWTCVDALYAQYNDGMDPVSGVCSPVDDFVTHKDVRLFIPPDMICDGTTPAPFWESFDANENGEIEKAEVLDAIDAYFAQGSEMTKEQVMEVINKFFEFE